MSYIKNYGNLYAQTYSYSNGQNIFDNITSNSLSITGNVSAGNLIAVGNVSGNYILGNGAFLTGLPEAYGNANVANYLPTYTGNLNPGNLSITGGQANLGPAANVKISGGTLNYYLTSDGAGGLAWAAGTGNVTGNGTVAGSDQQIQFNNGTANFAASAALRFDYTANILRVTGAADVTGNIDATGNISAAYFLGNGAFLTGLDFTNYSNTNVANYLPTYTGNLANSSDIIALYANAAAQSNAIANLQASTYSNANVAAYLPNYQGLISNIEFRSTSPAAAAIIVNDRSLTIGGNLLSYIILPDDGNANSVAAELTNHGLGNVIISSGPADYEWVFDNTGNLFAPGNIDAGNAISANYFLGNGAFLTGLPSGLSNADVANYLASNAAVTILTTGNITTSANIAGNYILGNGAFLTGIAANYGNGDVANYLASNAAVTVLTTGNITSSANIAGNYILGNGAFLTGIESGYSNADVANYLPTYTGAIDSLTGNVTTTANVQATYLLGNGAFITGLPAGYSNADVANYLASNANVTILSTGNITGNYIFGNGAFLTGIATSGYSNSDVANYLASNANVTVSVGTGNITTQGNIKSRALYVGSQQDVIYQVAGNVTLAGGALDNNANISIIANGSMTTSYVLSLPAGTPNAGEVLTVQSFGPYSGVGQTANLTWTAQSGGSYGNSNVADYLQVYNGNALFGNVTVSRDAVILGNLRVEGNTTYINVTDLIVEDKDIIVAANANATLSDLDGAGLQIGNMSAGGNITFFYDSTSNIMALSHGMSIANTLFVEGNVEVTGNVLAEYVDANYFVGNGALLTGLNFTNYSNANVVDYLASNANLVITTTGDITTTANITGSYIFGNGAFLTGISGGNAAALTVSLIDSGNVITNAVSNVEFLRFDANSGFGVEDLGNGNVKISLGSTFKTWVVGNSDPGQPNLVASGEDIVQFVQGNGIAFTSNNTPTGNAYKSLTIDVNLSSYTSNISTSANISGDYILGNGAFLTGISSGANLGNIVITAANISTNIANGNVGLSGNGSGYVFLSNVLPWDINTGLSNNTVDLGNSTYQFRDLYVGNVITPAGALGNATQIQPASGVGQSGVAFRDAVTGSAADVSAGVMYVDAIDATGSIVTDSYVEGNELISLGNLTVGDNANIANGIKVGGYANFLGNLKAENIAAVTNIEAQFYYGNGFYLTGINAANLVGAYSNADVANYLPIYNGNILAGNLTVSNNVIIQGNLQVLGNTTTIEANSLVISDKDITVANGALNASQANGAGIIVGASNIANIIYLSTPNYWSLYPGVYTAGNVIAEGNVSATGNITANNVTIVNTLTANTGNFTCCLEIGGATTTYFQAYTTSNAANQTLYEANAVNSAQLDFNIIATDPTLMGGSRQSSKILSTTYGNSTDFVEYGGVYINTPVGDFLVDQANGNVRLLVSPQTNANISYSVLVTRLV